MERNTITSTESSIVRRSTQDDRPEHSAMTAAAAIEVPEPQDLTKCVSMADTCADDDNAVIAAPFEATTNEESMMPQMGAPAEIPPEETTKPEAANNVAEEDDDDDDDDDWGSDDSYEYEDDDDVAFSGFLVPTAAPLTASRSSSVEPARIVEEDGVSDSKGPEESQKRKWKEPTRAAVNMSLRAQSESTGGKRRLAQDLYRIMNQDTEEAGFSLQPKSEDSMDSWVIKLFQFDDDSNLAKDMKVLGVEHIELEMKFPDQYPFEPPFVRVSKPRFKRQTGFVMNGALCMELLTKDGWNPINDIESVIVSIRSLLVVGDGRLHAAAELTESRYEALLEAASETSAAEGEDTATTPKTGDDEEGDEAEQPPAKRARVEESSKEKPKPVSKEQVGGYTASEAQSAYSHLSDYHKKKGWDTSGWWSRKG
jgi:ubiquitin-conjugating enzyme E2 Q